MKFVLDNIWLILIAFVSGGMLLWPQVRRSSGGPWVTTLEATVMINKEDALMLDVREPAEFAKRHVLNAKNLPLGGLADKLGELSRHKDKPVIVHCETGSRSGSAAAVLRKGGFTRVYNLNGGIKAWSEAGLPLTS